MVTFMQACWREWESHPHGVFHFKEDAARLGQPAREYNHMTLSWPQTLKAAWLPPQAFPKLEHGPDLCK